MSLPVPGQPSSSDAVPAEFPSVPPVDRPLPDFQPHAPSPYSPIDREIERSQRASAALAATRALTRASFTDSQLAAEDADSRHDADGEFDSPPWIRTEYAALDHPVRTPADDDAPRHLVGGSFNPGIASQHGRAFPSPFITNTAIRTRTGAQARFLQESRQTPRPERAASQIQPPHAGGAHDDRAAVMPVPAPAMSRAASRTAPGATASQGEPLKFLAAAALGAALVLVGGGVAWKAGVLSRGAAAPVAVQAPAATEQAIEIAPAAGVVPTRTSAEVDAALAAAARAAAVPAASVRAAGPAPVVRSTPPVAVTPAPAAPTSQRTPALGKDGVAAAIVNAQSRSDKFLSSEDGAAVAPTPPAIKRDE